MVYHQPQAVSQHHRCISAAAGCLPLRDDKMQHYVLVICNASHWWYTRLPPWFLSPPLPLANHFQKNREIPLTKWKHNAIISKHFIWRHSQAVRQRSAKPLSPVRFRVAPPKAKAPHTGCFCFWMCYAWSAPGSASRRRSGIRSERFAQSNARLRGGGKRKRHREAIFRGHLTGCFCLVKIIF